jgi:hypothetical protein
MFFHFGWVISVLIKPTIESNSVPIYSSTCANFPLSLQAGLILISNNHGFNSPSRMISKPYNSKHLESDLPMQLSADRRECNIILSIFALIFCPNAACCPYRNERNSERRTYEFSLSYLDFFQLTLKFVRCVFSLPISDS